MKVLCIRYTVAVLIHRKIVLPITLFIVSLGLVQDLLLVYASTSPTVQKISTDTQAIQKVEIIPEVDLQPVNIQQKELFEIKPQLDNGIFKVPFYSQFKDITSAKWKKVGCGIASLAMLIEFYEPGSVNVDSLLQEGISAGAYTDAGWTHGGLIGLSKKYGLSGSSHDLAGSSMDTAFNKLKAVLKDGPVMVSVHYTFDPKNPIPHLVVVNGVSENNVYYNDPSEKSGGGSIPIKKFQSAWKKRYIEIRPIS